MRKYFLKATTPDGEAHVFPLSDSPHEVGRVSNTESLNKLSITGDPSLSRSQFEVKVENGHLRVTPFLSSRNKTGFQGLLESGGEFSAAGTTFTFYSEESIEVPAEADSMEPTEYTLNPSARLSLRQEKAERCLTVMTNFFPRLRKAETTEAMWRNTYELVHELLPKARVAIIENGNPRGDLVNPSRKLLKRAEETENTVLHLFDQRADFTRTLGTDWAIAVPLPGGVILYAEGTDSSLSPGTEERVVLDLVGEILSHHLLSRRLEQVGRFLSPSIRDIVYGPEFDKVLKPRLAEVTVLYFDLRWSSRAIENADLVQYQAEMTELMTQLTDCVFARDGTVIDYVGDAVLACWGAPLDQPDHAQRAVIAAVDMHCTCRSLGKACGVGLATGQVIAGQVGARGQAKYGLIGTAPNVAARLEGLTKHLSAPILLAGECREQNPPGIYRRLMRVRPAGMENTVEVHELVLPKKFGGLGLDAEACREFEEGNWKDDDPVACALREMGLEGGSDTVLEMFKK
jgi:adenylate cyclase